MWLGLRKNMGTYFPALFGIWVLTVTSSSSVYCLARFYPLGTVVMESDDPSAYSRFNEIKKECSSVLAEASELSPDRNRKYMIKNELSFLNGDWKQQKGSAPLMPYAANYRINESHSPINLASFWINGVDPIKVSGKMVNVRGILQLAISSSNGIFYRRSRRKDFITYPHYTSVTIHLEGVYLEESKNSQEERLLCMLGRTHLSARGKNASDPWDWFKVSESQSPTLLEDDRILLHLRYPSKLSLTTREIQGTLTSLNRQPNSTYFDEIEISSQLAADSNYEFDSETLVAKACAPGQQYPDNFQAKGIKIYQVKQFCSAVKQLMDGKVLDVFTTRQCNGTDAYCSKLGPFIMDDKVHETDGSFDNTKLYIQELVCAASSNSGIADVSAVFRVVPPSQDLYLASERTGLNGLTLPAEGKWNSSSGQLCMVGCLGSIKNHSACNSRICIYMPLSLSIKQRSVIVGSIFSTENTINSFYPLSFELMHPRYLPQDVLNKMSYEYNKTKLAQLERDEPGGFGKSFLKYPQKEPGKTRQSFSVLSEDLSVNSLGVFDPFSKGDFIKSLIVLDVIAIEEFVGVDWEPASNLSVTPEKVQESAHSKGPEESLKVAAQLKLEGNVSKLFLEGFYDPRVGRMYLIGCRDLRRDARAPSKVLHDTGDLEDGFDCLIEVKVEYPPINARWFINPTMKISVKSQRPKDSPLIFRQIEIQNIPLLYRSQREEIISRISVEQVLRILTLSMMIGCILSQLFYSREKTEVAPYISLVMLGSQALGYSIPLITGAEALFKRLKSEPEGNVFSVPIQGQESDRIDYTVKLLLLIACLLTLRLFQKVWKSRIRLLARSPLEPWRVPSDKRVLAISSAMHAMGFLIVLIVHNVKTSSRPIQSSTYLYSKLYSHNQHEWETELMEYVGLVQDFFLLPQIVGNTLWHFERKPLRKLYYIGITVLQLLPHIYDYLRPPVFNPYFAYEYEFESPSLNSSFANPGSDFYSKFGDIAIPVTAVVLAIVILIQQRWNKLALSQAMRLISSKMKLPGTRIYERLPSKTFETELVSGCTERS